MKRSVFLLSGVMGAAVCAAEPMQGGGLPGSSDMPLPHGVLLAETSEASNEATATTYRIARVLIPNDSVHREEGKYDSNSPPDLYVLVYRNGNPVGKQSDVVEGYDVAFSDQSERNRYVIDGSDEAEFSIKVMDRDLMDPDDEILSLSGLKAADFNQPIQEQLGENDSQKRAITIYFKPVD